MYYCPRCGEALNFDDTVYLSGNRAVIGCESCLDLNAVDAEDILMDMDPPSISITT